MKFKDLYDKGLDRKVNPAVSASDLTDETVLTEIVEYVFTEEIIINLYNILTNIKVNQGSHIGIWINGYYGSGKSHFLKYASYCLSQNKERCEMAFIRLIEATEDMMLHTKGMSKLEQEGVSVSELKALQSWYVSQADVEMVMFNIGDVHDVNADQKTAFTTIFWNQFNAQRGYNSFNLALAQYLEKALDDNGKFQEFKDYVKSKGYDWERNISRFAAGRLDLALAVNWTAESIDDAADHGLADRDLHDAARALDLVAFFDFRVAAEDNGADVVLLKVQDQTINIMTEIEQLASHGLVEAMDMRDAVADFDDRSDIIHIEVHIVVLDLVLDDGGYFFRIHFHTLQSPLIICMPSARPRARRACR